MKPIGKHKWLCYCCVPTCGKLLHDIRDMFFNVRRHFYVCSPECKEAWGQKPRDEQERIIDGLRKQGY